MGAPFVIDTSNPADTGIPAQFPTNERANRTTIAGYLNTEHDFNTGFHSFQILTTTQKTGLTNPPTGMLVWDSTLLQMQINTGTPGTPVWTTIGGVPSGSIFAFGGGTLPTGYLFCDATSYLTSAQPTLFAAIGYAYGGSGANFNVPDGRGRTIFGFDAGNATGRMTKAGAQGIDASALGNSGGEQAHTQTANEMVSHNHTLTDPGHVHTIGVAPAGAVTASAVGEAAQNRTTATTSDNGTTGITLAATGGGAAANVTNPGIIANYIIKT